jgi:hypothetical protein
MTAASEVPLDRLIAHLEKMHADCEKIQDASDATALHLAIQHLRSHRPEGREATREPPSCTQASAVSERVSDELTQHFQRISEDHARDLERSKSGRWRLTLAGQDIGHLLNYIERLRHGSGELVEAAKFIEQLREIRQFCAVPSRAGWAVALDGVIAALANHARLSPEGSDEASSHNQD